MQVASEIQSNLNNLRYYNQQIAKLAKQQFDLDYERGQQLGINTGPGSIRFDSLGAIMSACSWIDCYANNIATNLHHAESQDKLLHVEEEVE